MKTPRTSPAKLSVAVLLAAILLALVLRLYSLADDNLWLDEGASLMLSAGAGPGEVIRDTALHDPHPPGYYLALHLWRNIFGSSDAALRGLSVALSVATVPVLFLLGSALFGRSVGITSAVLLALMPASVRYAQEARSYAMLVLLIALAWLFALRVCRERNLAATAGFALTAMLLPFTHYWGGVALAVIVLLSLFTGMRDAGKRAYLLQLGPGTALSLSLMIAWMAAVLARQMETAAITGAAYQLPRASSIMAAFGRPFGYDLLLGPAGVLAIATGLGCATLAWWLWRDGEGGLDPATPGARWWAIGMLLIPFALIALIGSFTTFWIGVRVPNITLLPTTLLCSAAVVGLWQRRRWAAIVLSIVLAALCGHGLWRWYTAPPRPDWETIAATIEAREQPSDVVVTIDSNFVPELFAHYYDGALEVHGISRDLEDPVEVERAALDIWPDGGRMWLILMHAHDSRAPEIVREMADSEEQFRVGDVRFHLLDYPSGRHDRAEENETS